MGAWIEIYIYANVARNPYVAPLMGAWIEIGVLLTAASPSSMSRPSWARGLKY